MNARPEYEFYRVILDYEALQDGFLDRIDELDTTQGSIPGFADGVVQKLLTKNPGKAIKRPRDHRSASAKRTFGWESLGKMLQGTGLALVLVVDDARFAPIKEQLAKRRRVSKPTNVSIKRPSWLFTKRNAANMRALGVKSLSPQQRKRIAKRAAKARWRKVKSAALIEQPAPQLDVPSPPGSIDAHPPRCTPSAYQVPADPC